jgi:hypothetical protein
VAARAGDGLWTSGIKEIVDEYRNAGGKGPIYSQLTLCWAESEEKARATAHELWAFSALPGELNQNLRTMSDFEDAVALVSEDELAKKVPCGPSVERIMEAVHENLEAGVDHLYFHQIGTDQEGFLEFWQEQLRPELSKA